METIYIYTYIHTVYDAYLNFRVFELGFYGASVDDGQYDDDEHMREKERERERN